MARADYTKELQKTQVNKTEQASYEAAIEKLNKKWMEDYKLTQYDSTQVKTLIRLAHDGADIIPTEEAIQEAYLTLKEHKPNEKEQKRLGGIRGINGETQRD